MVGSTVSRMAGVDQIDKTLLFFFELWIPI